MADDTVIHTKSSYYVIVKHQINIKTIENDSTTVAVDELETEIKLSTVTTAHNPHLRPGHGLGHRSPFQVTFMSIITPHCLSHSR